MAIFTIFWCAVLGIFFWLFSMLLKSIQAAMHGIFEAVVNCISIVILGVIGSAVLCIVFNLAAIIRENGFWNAIGQLIFGVIVFVLIFALLGSVGTFVFQVANIIVSVVMGIILAILETLNPMAENAYAFFLKKIKQKVDLL